ncbi:sensor histidine kinase [Acinetobacter qingfengensis]|nr:ATP-binding protein [Acinetobacter qingfengensis]
MLLILVKPSYAQSNLQLGNCTAHIQNMYIAKGIGKDHLQRPENGWLKIKTFPDFVDSHWKNYSGNIWYKIQLNYDCPVQQHNPVMLVINRINVTGEIFINDDLLWQDQSLVEPLSRSWNMPRYWNIPASSLKKGENTLWIRVISVPTQSSGLGKVFIGNPKEIMPKFQEFWYEQRVLTFFNLIFSLTLGIVALIIWLFHHQEKVFGWFALTSLAWVLFLSGHLISYTPAGLNQIQFTFLNLIILNFYSVFFCFYAWRLARVTFPKIEKILWIFLLTITFIPLLPFDQYQNTLLFIYFFTGILILFANFISFQCIAWKVKQIESTLLAYIFIIYIFISIHDLYGFFFIKNQENLLFPYTGPITTFFIAIILGLRLSKNIKEISRFNKVLEENIIQTRSELTNSLTTQYKLELINIKLQERINLAHDLHDGLGGSLVRSMALIDQSKVNLSNEQFLSMLKLLRDDLRQIIDSGSSVDAKIPKTPILWGAPIRYRFSQLFDEMDIYSYWHFPNQWEIKPSPLECLTLLRVAEESLTNIIKHSQATQVKVQMFYNDQQQLILEIQDNGIGFDPALVQQSGLSIGIRSMNIRLEKINAKMKIDSQAGRTIIQVIKSFNTPKVNLL